MKLTQPTVAIACIAVAGALFAAESESMRVHVRLHHSRHDKLYFTPIGNQCAYDPNIDPTMYPCLENGVCVRFNETYGKCVTEAEADKYLDSSSGSVDEELLFDVERNEEGRANEGSVAGSGSLAESAEVGSGSFFDEEAEVGSGSFFDEEAEVGSGSFFGEEAAVGSESEEGEVEDADDEVTSPPPPTRSPKPNPSSKIAKKHHNAAKHP